MGNLSIAQKLSIALGVAIVLLAVGLGVSYRQSSALADALRATSSRLESLVLLTELRISLASLADLVRAADETDSGLDIQRYDGAQRAMVATFDALVAREGNTELGGAAAPLAERVRAVDMRVRAQLHEENADVAGLAYLEASAEMFQLGLEVRELERGEREILSGGLAGASAVTRNPVLINLLTLLTTMALAVAFIGTVIRRYVLNPIRELTRVASNIVESGDLTQHITVTSNDEVGRLAQTLQRVVDKLRAIPSSLDELVSHLNRVVEELSGVIQGVNERAKESRAQAGVSASLLDEATAAIDRTGATVESLRVNSDETGSANRALVERSDEMMTASERMSQTSASLKRAADRLAGSADAVASSVGQLEQSIDDTSGTLTAIDEEIGRVGSHAAQTRELASATAEEAEAGSRAMQNTMRGIDEIRETSTRVTEVVSELGARIETIGSMVEVITDVAKQTSLLSLNAAIIASQAGEDGRSFAVVAEEVKALAERTHHSSREIASLVESIQDDAQVAVTTAGQSITSVEHGVSVGEEANDAFARILESAHRTSSMVDAIADSVAGQTSQSRRVTEAVVRIAQVSKEINTATAGQAGEADELQQLATEVAGAATRVHDSSRQQVVGSTEISHAIDGVQEVAREIDAAQATLRSRAQSMRKAVGNINDASTHQYDLVEQLDRSLANLREQAARLTDTVRQFRY